ncbi:MAG: methyltransferase domain-containing protein [Candidatus Hydrogenedentes bacterium]|nr:methyltransferase domain-containing protein [Candidatus Hydrogenedentota bacterium]
MGEDVSFRRSGILPLWTNVRTRCVLPELMDRQDLDPRQRTQALAGLRRINRLSLTSRHIWHPVRAFARAVNRPVRLLDLASGGGDVVLDLARFARHEGISVAVSGCDLNPEAVAHANERARRVDIDASFFVHDVLADPLPAGFDVITNSLFMHHFEIDRAVRILKSIRGAEPKLVVISDLERGTPGFLLAHLACQFLTRSYVVHYDGPRSVAAAFTIEEFGAAANAAGFDGHRIRRTWPFRFLFTWEA